MKIHALYDRMGRIQAAVYLDPPDEPGMPLAGEVRPVAKRGETAGDFEVPAEFASRDFGEVCRLLRVDPKRQVLVAAPRAKTATTKAGGRPRKTRKKK